MAFQKFSLSTVVRIDLAFSIYIYIYNFAKYYIEKHLLNLEDADQATWQAVKLIYYSMESAAASGCAVMLFGSVSLGCNLNMARTGDKTR